MTPLKRLTATVFLGFSSGVPFLLTLSTLSVWLKESGVSNTVIGLFVLFTLPYSLKFIWAPLIDHVSIPFLTPYFGKRRSWALVTQILLMLSLIGLGNTNPADNITLTALMTFLVALCSASQDLVVEAYRIESVEERLYGPAAAATYLGFRLGMLVSGAGALYLASFFSWSLTYQVMAGCILVGSLTILCSPEPRTAPLPLTPPNKHWFRRVFWGPLKDLLAHHDWRIILSFIFFYKVGDTALNVMNTPFLIDIGFSKLEIANIAKLFGISAMIIGGLIGGIFLKRFGLVTCLVICCALQVVSSLIFVIQALVGANIKVLILTIGLENLTGGLGSAAFIAYLSRLCSTPNTATHFALLSSWGSFMRVILSLGAGWLADQVSWESFYIITALGCIPSLILLTRAASHFPHLPESYSV